MGGHSKDPFKAADRHLAYDGMKTGIDIANALIEMMNIRRSNRFAVPFYRAIIERLQKEIAFELKEPNPRWKEVKNR